MRGFPLLNTFIVFIGLFAIAWPFYQMTYAGKAQDHQAQVQESSRESVAKNHALVRVKFAHQPRSFSLTYLDQKLFQENAVRTSTFEKEVVFENSDQGVDLLIKACWPEGTPETVVEVTIEPEGKSTQKHSVWGEAEVEEVLFFEWNR